MYSNPRSNIDPDYGQAEAAKHARVSATRSREPRGNHRASAETVEPKTAGARHPAPPSGKTYSELVLDALRQKSRSDALPHPPAQAQTVRLKYIKRVVDHHGVVRIYYVRGGKPYIRLDAAEGTPAFLDAYEAAKRAKTLRWRLSCRPSRPRRTMTDLVGLYRRSEAYTRLAPQTQRVYDRVLQRLLHDGDLADCSAATFGRRRVQTLVDRYAATPAAAADLLKKLRILFGCAVARGWRSDDPTRGVRIGRDTAIATRRQT